MEGVEFRLGAEYPVRAQSTDDWVAPEYHESGKVVISDRTGSYTGTLPDELLELIFHHLVLGDDREANRTNARNLAGVCRRWYTIMCGASCKVALLYPHIWYRGADPWALSARLNQSIEWLDEGKAKKREIASIGEQPTSFFARVMTVRTKSKDESVVSQERLLIGAANGEAVQLWDGAGASLHKVEGSGRFVRLVTYDETTHLLCQVGDQRGEWVQLHAIGSKWPVCRVRVEEGSEVLFLDVHASSTIAYTLRDTVRLHKVATNETVNTEIQMRGLRAVECDHASYLIGADATNHLAYLPLPFTAGNAPVVVGQVDATFQWQLLDPIAHEECVYCPIWTPRGPGDHLPTLRFLVFKKEEEAPRLSKEYRLSSSDQPPVEVALNAEGVAVITQDRWLHEWQWRAGHAPQARQVLPPTFRLGQTDLNNWGAIRQEIVHGHRLIKRRAELLFADRPQIGHLQDGLLFIEAGEKGRRALCLQGETLRCFDPSQPLDGSLRRAELHRSGQELIINQSRYLLFVSHTGRVVLYSCNDPDTGTRRVAQPKRSLVWPRSVLTVVGLLGGILLARYIYQSAVRVQAGVREMWKVAA